MKILALEFSSSQRSVAVIDSGNNSASEVAETSSHHSMKPLDMVEHALQQARLEREQIECIAVGLGPGSYTGIRIGIALAQGWQLAASVKLLGVNSAECVAAQALADGVGGGFSVVIDAQREEFYVADYELVGNQVSERSPLKLATRTEVSERDRAGNLLIGPEVTKWFPKGRVIFPRAGMLGRLALLRTDFVTGEKLEPIYLREASFVKAPPPRVVA